MRVDGKLEPAIIIDDNPDDGRGYLELIYRDIVEKSNSTWRYLKQYHTSFYPIDFRFLDYLRHEYSGEYSASSLSFGIAIPVGAAILATLAVKGESLPVESKTLTATLAVGFSIFHTPLAMQRLGANTEVYFNSRYRELTTYPIKEDREPPKTKAYIEGKRGHNKYFRTPLILVWPYIMTD